MKSFSTLVGLENLLFFFLYVTLKRNFLHRKSFPRDLNEAISLAELRVYMENFPQEESDYNSPLIILSTNTT